MPTFCDRIRAALPPTATFRARRVDYYPQSQGGNPRWALPDDIATSKLEKWAYQEETRLIFSLTDALNFENVKCQLSRSKTRDGGIHREPNGQTSARAGNRTSDRRISSHREKQNGQESLLSNGLHAIERQMGIEFATIYRPQILCTNEVNHDAKLRTSLGGS